MEQTLKQEILHKRKYMDKDEIKKKSEKIRKNLVSLPEFEKAKNILFYVSFESEVDTQELIKQLLEKKRKKIIVPFVVKNNHILQLSELRNFNELESRTFGILEPKELYKREFNPEKLDLVIIPGLVFDKRGHRIGYGFGYYDRFLKTLKNNPKKIGLAYEFQIMDKIPEKLHDVPIDIIVTEKQTMNCNNI